MLRILGAVVIIVLLGIVVGIFALDYRAGIALLLGIITALILLVLFRWLRRRKGPIWPFLLLPGVLLGIGWAVLSALPDSDIAPAISVTAEPQDVGVESADAERRAVITEYRAFIEADETLQVFMVQEEIVYDVVEGATVTSADLISTFPPRPIEARKSGFLLYVVEYSALVVEPTSDFDLIIPDGTPVQAALCPVGSCPPGVVEIRDLPKGAFADAQGADDFQRTTFVNTETITYKTESLRRGVAFAFVPPPFNAARPLLSPVLGAASLQDWVLAVIGLFSTLVFFPLIAAFLENYLEGKLFDGARGLFGQRKRRRK